MRNPPGQATNRGLARSLNNGVSMPILQIQHAVPNFEGWKRAFGRDRLDRKGFGVRRYHVHRSVADPTS